MLPSYHPSHGTGGAQVGTVPRGRCAPDPLPTTRWLRVRVRVRVKVRVRARSYGLEVRG